MSRADAWYKIALEQDGSIPVALSRHHANRIMSAWRSEGINAEIAVNHDLHISYIK